MFMTLKHGQALKNKQLYAAFSVPFLAVFALAVMPVTVQAHPDTAPHHDDPDHPDHHEKSEGN